MYVRFQVRLTGDDYEALMVLADEEYREPRQMAGFLIREALQKRGLLDPETEPMPAPSGQQQPRRGEVVQ